MALKRFRRSLGIALLPSVLLGDAFAVPIHVPQAIDCGKGVYTFDTSSKPALTRASFEQALAFSPTEASGQEIVAIDLPCPPGVRCDDGSQSAPDYDAAVKDALSVVDARIDRLQRMQVPVELAFVRDHTIESLEFWRDLHRNEAKFYSTWDPEYLRKPYDDEIDPRYFCSKQSAAIERTIDKTAKWSLTHYEWHNCVNKAYHDLKDRDPGGYAGKARLAWNNYLKAYHVQWKYDPKGNPSCE